MNLELEQEFKVEMKAGKIDRACQRYDLGRNTMRRIAEAAGAVIRIGRIYLIMGIRGHDNAHVKEFCNTITRA